MLLLERAGRGVRLTDAALVLVRHAEATLDRADLAEAELAAAAGSVEAEPEKSLPALALGDIDLVLADGGSTSRTHGPPMSAATAVRSVATGPGW